MGNTNEVVAAYVSPEKMLVLIINKWLINIFRCRIDIITYLSAELSDGYREFLLTRKTLDLIKNYEDMLYYIEQKKEEDPISKIHPLQKDYIRFLEKNVYIYENFDYETEMSLGGGDGYYLLKKLEQIEIELQPPMYRN
tara:strand:- start:798 stop:1214 length:417 start_codon:yes stop_codon:yes gene_type:complete